VKLADIATVSFGSSAAISISVIYTIDSYRPICRGDCGEPGYLLMYIISYLFRNRFADFYILTNFMDNLAIIAFLMSFYANPWIDRNGYARAFSIMVGCSPPVPAFWIPIYI
jgi:hypothetical protein